ncbi:hypothetical protein AUC61_16570 [Pseudomonas sp. S25]|uniref:Uncharacterized protein n=1 Tax=Pseudomonas maioricensis TaxID=1766623 RepID=A0ABS9ZKN5_9PSED|nr:hypothetical protein [Pseudomonas sp. S25]MCI8211144.1 hypothetical protein [Pseudomonas sp. S25]
MANFLLGWCVVSLFGTLLALRLIRSGKSRHARSAEIAETEQDAPADTEVSQPPADYDIQPGAGR